MSKDTENLDMSDVGSALPAAAAALSAEDRAGLVNALKDKLQNLAGEHSDVLETLSPMVRKRVEVLRELQSQHDDLEAKFLEERAALEAKYQKLYEPLYTKRYEIVNDVVEVKEAGDAAQEGDKGTEDCEKGVPNFWLLAMKTNVILAEEITERDEAALKYLKDIKWCKIDNPKGFKLEFFFDTNPFFKNSVLTKTYHMIDEDEPILERAVGTKIEWCPGKCLTQKILKKKPKKGSKNSKPITKTENCESFFNFFNPPQIPADGDDYDEDAAEDFQNLMEQDYDIGSTIRDKIIPHAVYWFTGEAADEDDFEDEDDEDELDEEEDEGDDDDEEDEVEISGKKSSRTKKRVEVLKELQSQCGGLESKFREERAALEAKYHKLYDALYTKLLVEVEGVGDASQGQDKDQGSTVATKKGVPKFWLLAMKSDDLLADEISERDEQVLRTIIDWYPGKCLTQQISKKRPHAKCIMKINTLESFFNFFNPPQLSNDKDVDEDTAEEYLNLMKQDYDIGSINIEICSKTIRDKIIPQAVSWFMAAEGKQHVEWMLWRIQTDSEL
ncbi:OLC1v1015061C1 [Oldenlandia corymbosa var. corymbosa]|uniref:OLC1v1015061C1 n=1 Tax=Oldenlandia corymbosa var. corymbosa TaxID=529605 RepID=A0AAV1E298_OLDCO|nr:OLC1v1015061C1 [Oldenlandia corymbosa var. corymbosa]